jgi:hypothetical protein
VHRNFGRTFAMRALALKGGSEMNRKSRPGMGLLGAKLSIALVALALTSLAPAAVYDVAADFSLSSNPNGVWSYGSEDTLGGAFTLFDTATTCCSGLDYWTNSSGFPVDLHNSSASTINSAGTNPIPAGAAAFHPSSIDQYAIFRFTAPSSGLYDLNVTFTGYDTVGTTTDVHVLQGTASLFAGNVNGYLNTASHAQSGLVLATNDFIDFAVGWGINQNYLFDTTGIAASLASETDGNRVPEPATLGLLTIGLGVLIFARSRKKIALRSC